MTQQTTTEAERAAFEAWANRRCIDTTRARNVVMNYGNYTTEARWEAWQAARHTTPVPAEPVQRFNNRAGLMNPEANGLYVRYEDHCAALATAPVAVGEPALIHRPMDTAPKDGTLVRLLVMPDRKSFTPFDDSMDAQWTVGFNNLENTGEDRWQFAGWDWQQDEIIEGHGDPVGWLPLLDAAAPQPPSPAGVADALDAARYRWLRKHREVLLLTGFFGNGCINKTVDMVDAKIDAALAESSAAAPVAVPNIGTQIAQAEFLKRWDDAANRQPDQSVMPEYLAWLRTDARREGVAGNEAWNAGVAWARAAAPAVTVGEPLSDERLAEVIREHFRTAQAGATWEDFARSIEAAHGIKKED